MLAVRSASDYCQFFSPSNLHARESYLRETRNVFRCLDGGARMRQFASVTRGDGRGPGDQRRSLPQIAISRRIIRDVFSFIISPALAHRESRLSPPFPSHFVPSFLFPPRGHREIKRARWTVIRYRGYIVLVSENSRAICGAGVYGRLTGAAGANDVERGKKFGAYPAGHRIFEK